MAAAFVAGSGCQPAKELSPDEEEKMRMQICGTDAELCAAQRKDCGQMTATDTCSRSRKVECGSCTEPQSCGGGGSANVCGASCPQGCPAGFKCNSFGVCAGGSLSNIVLDVKAVPVSGKVTLNGRTPIDGASCTSNPNVSKARVIFTDDVTGTSISPTIQCQASSYTWSALVPPGTYRTSVYGFGSPYTELPDGQAGIGTPITISSAQSNLVLDVKAVQISGKVTLNGRTPSDGTSCTSNPNVSKARVYFIDTPNGTSISPTIQCQASSYTWSALVPPGTYRTSVYGFGSPYTELPDGQAGIGTPITISSAQSNLVLDVKAVQISGKVTLNGRTPIDGTSCTSNPNVSKARVYFIDTPNGTSISPTIQCQASSYTWSALVPPGTYRTSVYGFGSPYTELPDGQAGIGTPITISSAQSNLVLDVKAVQISGKVTLNGRTPSDGTSCTSNPNVSKARVYFIDTPNGTSISPTIQCQASSYTWSALVPPGTYRTSVYGFGSPYTELPDGQAGIGTPITISSAQSNLVLDVKAVQISGKVTLNGRTPIDGTSCTSNPNVSKARVYFIDTPNGTSISPTIQCQASSYTWSALVPPGTYRTSVYGFGSPYTELPDGQAGVVQLAVP